MKRNKPKLYINLGNVKKLNVHPVDLGTLQIRSKVILTDGEQLYCNLPPAVISHRIRKNPNSVIPLYIGKGVHKKKDFAERWIMILIKSEYIKSGESTEEPTGYNQLVDWGLNMNEIMKDNNSIRNVPKEESKEKKESFSSWWHKWTKKMKSLRGE